MRLIDADALKAKWYKINDIDETDRGARFMGYTEIARLIDHAPTIDAVEVVRCKDCKHGAIAYPLFCRKGKALATIEDGNNFCSYGERREE